MHRYRLAGALLLGVACSVPARALQEPSPPDTDQPLLEQVREITEDFEQKQQSVFAEYEKAQTDEERASVLKKLPDAASYFRRLWIVADAAEGQPAELQAMKWILQHGASPKEIQKVLERTLARHRESPELKDMCSLNPSAQGEVFLRALLDSPHHEVRGQATFALAGMLHQMAEAAPAIQKDAETATMYRGAWGAECVESLLACDPDELSSEAQDLLEEVQADFAALPHYRGGLGKAAAGMLNQIQNLAIGKTAPEITGEDIDGTPFKLSDYRGKVVMIDFWGDW